MKQPSSRIRVLVVEDSASVRALLVRILETDPEINVIGTAKTGREAVDAALTLKPDVISMDLVLPEGDGLFATAEIMKQIAIPIVIVSSVMNFEEIDSTFKAIEKGAVTAVKKPGNPESPDFQAQQETYLRTIKFVSEMKLVSRHPSPPSPVTPSNGGPHRGDTSHGGDTSALDQTAIVLDKDRYKVVCIGVSAGGPPILQTILSGLTPKFPIPILIVQHIAVGFLQPLAEWLEKVTGMPTLVARNEEMPLPGKVYLAPEGRHLTIDSLGRMLFVSPSSSEIICPSVARLFSSAAKYMRSAAIGILLSGMGRDGALELLELQNAGALTIAQNEESSTIYGMPAEAAKLHAAKLILSPEEIVAKLRMLTL